MTNVFLPVRELPLAGESLTGFLRRHVTAMGYQGLRQLLNLIENVPFPPHLDQLPRGAALAALTRFLRRDEDALLAMTAHHWVEQLVLRRCGERAPPQCDSKTLLRYFQPARPRVCPKCVETAPHGDRLVWSFRPLGICPEHGAVLLTRCPGCRSSFSSLRLDLVRCRCGYTLVANETPTILGPALEQAQRVATWLHGEACAAFDLPPQATFWWLDRLRAAVGRTPAWLGRVRAEWNLPPQLDEESTTWLAAAELVDHGKELLAEFLDEFQTVEKHRSTSTGAGRSFGTLLHDVDRLERLGFAAPAEMLREYLLARYDRGHLTSKVILFRSGVHRRRLAKRHWISQTAAARRLGVRLPSIAALVRRGALVGRIESAGKRGRTVGIVRSDSVEAIRKELSDTLSTVEAGKRLGVQRHRILDLIHAGVLRQVLRTAGGWRIARGCVDDILRRAAELPMCRADDPQTISLYQASRHFGGSGVTLARWIEEILAGSLPARRSVSEPTLRGVYLELEEVRRFADATRDAQELERGYPLNRLAAQLIPGRPVKEVVLRKWIRAGLLRAHRLRKAWRVAPTEVARFHRTYCLADEACELLGVTRSTLARWEFADRIAPVYGRRTHSGAGASVFLRADVERLAAGRAA